MFTFVTKASDWLVGMRDNLVRVPNPGHGKEAILCTWKRGYCKTMASNKMADEQW